MQAALAAEFLSAAHSKQALAISGGFEIDSIRGTTVEAPGGSAAPNVLATMMGVMIIVLLGLLLGVLVTGQRKRARGITWFPEGFLPMRPQVSGGPRRRPDGQEMHSIAKMSNDQRLDANDNHGLTEWSDEEHHPPAKRMRPTSGCQDSTYGDTATVMSNADYDDHDTRQWTRQHLNAADIRNPDIVAMTPPQHHDYDRQVDVDVRGPAGLTPLMLVSIRGNGIDQAEEDVDDGSTIVIQELLDKGAKITNKTEHLQETPLHLAARYARSDAAKLLLDMGANANAVDASGRTPLHSAVAADAVGVFQILLRNRTTDLNSKTYDGTTPLILACRMGVEGMVTDLINAEVDVNLADEHGKTALHWAAAVNNYTAVKILLDHGANRDAQDLLEETPLYLAAREGSRDAAKILLEYGANRDITDHMDRLPRGIALDRLHHDLAKMLDEYVPTNPIVPLPPVQLPQPLLVTNSKPAPSVSVPTKSIKKTARRNQSAFQGKEPPPTAADSSAASANRRRTPSVKKKRDPPPQIVVVASGAEGALSPSSLGSPCSSTLSPQSSLFQGHSMAVSQPNLTGGDIKQPPCYEDCVKGASGIYDMAGSTYGGVMGILDSHNIYTSPMQPPLQPQPAVNHGRQQSLPAGFSQHQGNNNLTSAASPTKARPVLPTSPTHLLAMRQQQHHQQQQQQSQLPPIAVGPQSSNQSQTKPKISSGSAYEFPVTTSQAHQVKMEPSSIIYSGSPSHKTSAASGSASNTNSQYPPAASLYNHYPTPPSVSQVSQSDQPTPQHYSVSHDPSYLTPSPESPGEWSPSSSHSAQGDWSDAISSPLHPSQDSTHQAHQGRSAAKNIKPAVIQQGQKSHPDPVFI